MKKSDKTDTKQAYLKTEQKKLKFLKVIREQGVSVLGACKIVGVGRQYMYQLRSEDSHFAQEWNIAVEEGKQTLKDMALSVIYDQLKNNDKTVAMFVLRQLDPQTWNKDRERVGESARPVQMTHTVSPRFAKVMERLLKEPENPVTSIG